MIPGPAIIQPSRILVSSDHTHHIFEGSPLYDARFDDVLKFHPPGLAAVLRGGEAWHIRQDGSAAYQGRFKRAFGFYDGLAAVEADAGWCHINHDGVPAYSVRFDWCGNFQGGRCAVRCQDTTYGHINRAGRFTTPPEYAYAGDFRDGVAVVQSWDGTSTHVREDGSLLHGLWFEDLDVFHKRFARAKDGGGWTHVDTAGRPQYVRRFAAVEPFYNGQARVERFDGGREVIDEAGRMVLALRGGRRP